MHRMKPYQRNALVLTCLLLLPALLSAVWIGAEYLSPKARSTESPPLTADVYRDGELIHTLPLSADEKPRTFTVNSGEGDYNEIWAGEGGIGVLSASCPDQLCVKQGIREDSLLPIVCLPNRLVIQIREESEVTPDIITY